jgi:aspartokinase
MLKIVLSFIIFSSFAFAISKEKIYTYYKNKDYENVCKKGTWIVNENKKNNNYLSIVALSCVNSDMLNTAIRISKLLGNTKIGRANASYIANLYLIKKLLIQFMYDKINLSNLSLPKSNHFLSKIFENLSKANYKKVDNKVIISLKNQTFILEKIKPNKISITIKSNNQTQKHIYW